MTSLCRHLSAQEIVNWVTTADGCVHTEDTTKLSPTSCEFVLVFTPPTRRDKTVSSRRRRQCVLGFMTVASRLSVKLAYCMEMAKISKKIHACVINFLLLFVVVVVVVRVFRRKF